MRPFDFQEGVELIVPISTGIGLVNFPDIPELRSDIDKDVVIRSMEVFPAEVTPKSFSGNAAATMAQIQNAFLTLYMGGINKVYKIPLVKLVSTYVGGTVPDVAMFWQNEVMQVENYKIDWTKSYVQFPTPISPNAQFSFVFSFGYIILKPGEYDLYRKNVANERAQGLISAY